MNSRKFPFDDIVSGVENLVWPPLPQPNAAMLMALSTQLESSQWLSAAIIAERQRQQLLAVITHAAEHSPYFRERLTAAGLSIEALVEPDGLRRLPVMTRRDIQAAGDLLFCNEVPQTHLPFSETRTSGSSGEPVVIRRSAISQLFWFAYTLREHLWYQRDFTLPLAIIRAFGLQSGPTSQNDWGPPVSLFFKSGPAAALPISNDISVQADWLRQLNPGYLLTYPTNLAALIDELQQRKISLPNLRQIRTIGETLPQETREKSQVLGVEIVDIYSSQEVGVVAIQCPQSGLYHVMAESLIVEVLDEYNNPCQVGETGRVVVTDLHNFATPIVRYDIGDYAEVGCACPCGRGLLTLKRILGRQRNMVVLPDGRRHWPLVGFQKFREIAPVRQYQIIQRSVESIEVRLVADHVLSVEQQTRLGNVICSALGHSFHLTYVYFEEELPRGANGKFEEFLRDFV